MRDPVDEAIGTSKRSTTFDQVISNQSGWLSDRGRGKLCRSVADRDISVVGKNETLVLQQLTSSRLDRQDVVKQTDIVAITNGGRKETWDRWADIVVDQRTKVYFWTGWQRGCQRAPCFGCQEIL